VVSRTILKTAIDVPKIIDGERIMALRKVLDKVVVTDALRDYAVRLVLATHPGTDFAPPRVRQFVKWGASPRAAQALIRAARVRALAEGRAHFASEVLGHRMLLNYDGQAENLDLAELVDECVKSLSETM
jgi:MoxR-like ATPase